MSEIKDKDENGIFQIIKNNEDFSTVRKKEKESVENLGPSNHSVPIYIVYVLILIIFLMGVYLYVKISACRYVRMKEALEYEKYE